MAELLDAIQRSPLVARPVRTIARGYLLGTLALVGLAALLGFALLLVSALADTPLR